MGNHSLYPVGVRCRSSNHQRLRVDSFAVDTFRSVDLVFDPGKIDGVEVGCMSMVL